MSAFTENLLLALLLGFLPQVSHPPVLAPLPSKCYSYTPSADQPLDMTIVQYKCSLVAVLVSPVETPPITSPY